MPISDIDLRDFLEDGINKLDHNLVRESDDLRDKLHFNYGVWLISELNRILRILPADAVCDGVLREKCQALLIHHSSRMKGTDLCYTPTHNDGITRFICELALVLAEHAGERQLVNDE